MTIKLVRTDTIPCKVELIQGEHVFGRGKLLDCDDKRISRQHGKLLVSDESVTLTALHQNPCFFQKKSSTESEILKINNSTVLNSGDRFGLLPNVYWYEVIVCKDDNNEQNTESISENDTEELNLDKTSYNSISKEINNEESLINYECGDNIEDSNRPESPSLLPGTTEESIQDSNKPLARGNEPAVCATNELPDSNTHIIQGTNETKQNTEDIKKSPSKRSHSPDNADAKKIKIEDGLKSEPTVKTEETVKKESSQETSGPDAKPGCSTNQMNPANNIGAPVPAPVRPRERCMYGAQCYRRNPNHRIEFSHPQDGDWGPGDRGVCPYGACCRRKNPSHWRDHDHPPGTNPPPPNPGPKRKRTPDRNILSQDLPAKRVRKMVQRQDFGDFDSDPEEDPYATDESDEWEPESSGTFYSEEYL